MKLTDLNFDCLESVLEYLELIDLSNVADSTTRLNKAAELVYARKHSSKLLLFDRIIISPNRLFKIKYNYELAYIRIQDLKTSLQLLRCFGRFVYKILFKNIQIITEIDIENLTQNDRKILNYIKNYCVEYLKLFGVITFDVIGSDQLFRSDLLEYFEKPFKNVVNFVTCDYNLTEKTCLRRLFPNLEQLQLRKSQLSSSFFRINTNNFPHLKEFRIEDTGNESFIENEMMLEFLQLNPQLKNLYIRTSNNSKLNYNLIRSAVDSLQNIEVLSIGVQPITFIDGFIIRMKSVKFFEIALNRWNELPIRCLPFSFGKLEKFEINFPKAEFYSTFNEEFFGFINKHPTITHLKIGWIDSHDVIDWSRLAKSLPSLVGIELSNCMISADSAIEIMAKFQILNQFQFELSDDYDRFLKRLCKQWVKTNKKTEKSIKLKRRI